jgi:hypothetical protein
MQMKSSLKDLPVTAETPQFVGRSTEWGGMNVTTGEILERIDVTPLLKGLSDDRCQCPHWGYVLKGQMRSTGADHEEVFNEGDLFYLAPGHTVIYEAGTRYIEFSPPDELRKTQEVVRRNYEAMNE